MDPSSFLHKYFELLSQMLKLLLRVVFSLIVDNFIVFYSISEHLKNLFIPLTFLVMQLNVIEFILERLDLFVALIFVAQVLIFNSLVFFLFLPEQVNFGLKLQFLLINSIVLFTNYSQVLMGSSILQIITTFLGLFSEFRQLSTGNKGKIIVFHSLVYRRQCSQL